MRINKGGKEWSCDNQCKSNCCSSVFLVIDSEQLISLKKYGFYYAHDKYSDWDWLSFHKMFKIEDEGDRKKITLKTDEYEIKYNDYLQENMLYVDDKCEHIMEDNRCAIFEDRPKVCRISECPVFSFKKKIQWYAVNGKLKEQWQKYKDGELKRWKS